MSHSKTGTECLCGIEPPAERNWNDAGN